jgi:hypothetical protein
MPYTRQTRHLIVLYIPDISLWRLPVKFYHNWTTTIHGNTRQWQIQHCQLQKSKHSHSSRCEPQLLHRFWCPRELFRRDRKMHSDAGGSLTHYLGQWAVQQFSNGTYRIQNVDHLSYANSEKGHWTREGDSIVGGTYRQHWNIMETSVKGDYWCVFYHAQFLIRDNRLCIIQHMPHHGFPYLLESHR